MKNYAELQYICPNCFSQRNVNDVLFLRNAVKRAPDYRKCRFWRVMNPDKPLPQYIRSLADWRAYPEDQRVLREGVVTGVVDFNGDLMNRRICPECHYPTAGPGDRELLTLFWTDDGADEERGEKFFSALEKPEGKWAVEKLPADPDWALLTYEKATKDGLTLKAPLGLKNGDRLPDAGLLERYIQGCNAAVVWVKIAEGEIGDLSAVATLRRLSAADGSCDGINPRPTAVFLLTGEQPQDLAAWLKEHHRNLFNALNSLFLQFQVFDWRDGAPEAVEEAADWLLQASFGTQG